MSQKNYCFKKIFCIRGEEDAGVSQFLDFPSKKFCLTVPKHLVEEPLCASEDFWFQTKFCKGGEGGDGGESRFLDFSSKLFWITLLKHFVQEPLCVLVISWYREFLWIKRGQDGSKIFRRKIFFSRYRHII